MNANSLFKTKKYFSLAMRVLTLFTLVVNAVAFPMPIAKAQTTNHAPVIDKGDSFSFYMSAPTIVITLHAEDEDGDSLSWNVVDPGASNGIAVIEDGNIGLSINIRYTPVLNYVGTDSFVIQVEDSYGNTDSIIVYVDVRPNTAPVIAEGDSVSRIIRRNGFPIPFSLTLFASDPDFETLTWSISAPPPIMEVQVFMIITIPGN